MKQEHGSVKAFMGLPKRVIDAQIGATMTSAPPKKPLVMERPIQARILQFRAWHGIVPGVRRSRARSLKICSWESCLTRAARRSGSGR
jgi:hypothetical protein